MNKRIAEALVECGYAKAWRMSNLYSNYSDVEIPMVHPLGASATINDAEPVDPFADTLEGRHQADALENWLIYKGYYDEFDFSKLAGWPRNFHQWRLDSIKRCFEELSDE